MKEVVYKVVRSTPKDGKFESLYAPTIHLDTGECIAQPLTYELDKWTEMLPNSLGIFVYKRYKDALRFLEGIRRYSNERLYILECGFKGALRPIYLCCDVKRKIKIKNWLWLEFRSEAYSSEYSDRLEEFRGFLAFAAIDSYTVEAIYPIKIVYPIKLED